MIPGAKLNEYQLEGSIKLYVLNVKENSKLLSDYINNYIVSICEGDSGTDLSIVKNDLLKFLDRKKETSTRMGAVAEFFVHLVLNTLNFKQECRYFNLEENSIKKGFDGYYSDDDNEWIMESKSGMFNSKNVSHPSKIKEAYDDISKKLSGDTENNPWKNAYNHASHIDVNTKKSIRENIKKMSDKFALKSFAKVEDFNIIPSSTIFLEGTWEEIDINELKVKLKEKLANFSYKNIIVICITKSSVKILQEILCS